MFEKILIANRGEIAVRIARTCKELGVGVVVVHSDVDARSRHVEVADEAVHLPGVAPADTYLDTAAVIDAALRTGAQAIHPGYGFLSENAGFAEAVADAGLVWIGPPAAAIRAVGDKVSARRLASAVGVPVVPGTLDPIASVDEAIAFGEEHGYPVAVKASGGGGGRGLKVARSADEIAEAVESARREAQAYFSSSEVYLERYLDAPKHLEVQLLAPSPDDALWLGVRDCSLQRRHQKLVEETPPPRGAERAAEMGAAAVALSKACGYVNAGTVEMLAEPDGSFYLLEVNSRLQVEHTVTEEVTGLDLVACQLRIAAGDPLGFSQDDVLARTSGHSIECRINAEDPARGFLPTPGVLRRYREPDGMGVRVDSGYREGDEIPGAYDSLLAKLIVRAPDREQARRRMLRALDDFAIEGVATTIPALRLLLEEPSFVSGGHSTATVEGTGVLDALAAPPETADERNVLLVDGHAVKLWHPGMAASASAAVAGGGATGDVVAPMQGTILKLLVSEGDEVAAGAPVAVLEAMKMETMLVAPRAGKAGAPRLSPGDGVRPGEVVVSIE